MSALGQKIIAEIRKVAADNPDFIYQAPYGDACFYVFNGQPSCIVGRALWNLGFIDKTLEKGSDNSIRAHVFLDKHFALDLYERDWIDRVQWHQDAKRTWGQAVEVASR
jgi:hypothetical protein